MFFLSVEAKCSYYDKVRKKMSIVFLLHKAVNSLRAGVVSDLCLYSWDLAQSVAK